MFPFFITSHTLTALVTTELFSPPLILTDARAHTHTLSLVTYQLCLFPFVMMFLSQQVADSLDIVLRIKLRQRSKKTQKSRLVAKTIFCSGKTSLNRFR